MGVVEKLSDVERKQFAEDNIKLVHHTVWKYFKAKIGRQFDFEDLVSIGTIGLMKAIDSFKPEYGNKFATYAVPMIWGVISIELRDKESVLKIPRPMKDLQYQLYKNNLLDSTAKEVAEKLGITEEKATEVLQLKEITYVDSLDREIGEDGGMDLYSKVGGYYQDFETELLIDDIGKQFKPREKQIMKLIMSGKTQEETGSIVGISQAEVSRALAKMKVIVKKYMRGEEMANGNEKTELAKKLVAEGKMSVSEIARETGLSTPTISYHKERFEKGTVKAPTVDQQAVVKNIITQNHFTEKPVVKENPAILAGFDFNISGSGQVPVKEFTDKLQNLIRIISNSGIDSVIYKVSVCNSVSEN